MAEQVGKTGPDVKLLDTSSQSVPAYIILHYGTFKGIWGWFILLLPCMGSVSFYVEKNSSSIYRLTLAGKMTNFLST